MEARKHVDKNGLRWRCATCDKVTAGRQPKARELDAIYPRRHRRYGGSTCPGTHHPAIAEASVSQVSSQVSPQVSP